jgi:hypothetical protein
MDGLAKSMYQRMAALPESARTDRVKAAEDFSRARAEHRARLDELSRAGASTWCESKARDEEAWRRARAAWDEAAR